VFAALAADLTAGDDLILSSYTNAVDLANGEQTLVADHALSIYGINASTGVLDIRNPWGVEAGQYWETTFAVSLSTLLADGDTISVAVDPPTTPVMIASNGTTDLMAVANQFALDPASGGSGPFLMYQGSAVTAGEFGSWAPIGAVKTASGYEVAWKESGADAYTIWNTDGNGNYLSFSGVLSATTVDLLTGNQSATGSGDELIDFTGSNETFLDSPGVYNDTIVGFSQAQGDRIHLTTDTVTDALTHATLVDGGQDTMITLADTSTITLKGVTHVDSTYFS
jgi:hypothetical protein